MQTEENLQESLADPGDNMQLWGNSPVLDEASEQNYLGRVTIEVWANDQSRLITSDPTLPQIALLSLENNKFLRKNANNIALRAASGSNDSNKFVGHVIFEMWTKQVNVATTGSPQESTYLFQQAKAILESHT